MTSLEDLRFIERQQFFDGQRLFAADMQELEAFHRAMRELHNRSLHQPGIGNGFALTGEPGDRELVVHPGYAIDVDGHEIALIEEQRLQVPPVAGADDGGAAYFDLTIAYPADKDLEVAETRAGICHDRGAVRLREMPIFCWVPLVETEAGTFSPEADNLKQDIAAGRKLVIGRIAVLNCALYEKVSLKQRRSARPAHQPYVSCGAHAPDWELFWLFDRDMLKELVAAELRDIFVDGVGELSAQALVAALLRLEAGGVYGDFGAHSMLPFGLRAVIPTAAANFGTTPSYWPRIDGSRVYLLDLADEDDDGPIIV